MSAEAIVRVDYGVRSTEYWGLGECVCIAALATNDAHGRACPVDICMYVVTYVSLISVELGDATELSKLAWPECRFS